MLKFPHHVLNTFMWSIPFLQNLAGDSEAVVNENYLLARLQQELEKEEPAKTLDGIAKLCLARLVIMSQCPAPAIVVQAFESLDEVDQQAVAKEMTRTGVKDVPYPSCGTTGGPAFLVYYGPALLQRNRNSNVLMSTAMRLLCMVYLNARSLWPLDPDQEGQTVKVEIGQLKTTAVDEIIEGLHGLAWGEAWDH